MTMTLPPRNAVPVEHTWDTASVFATHSDWEAAIERVNAALPTLAAFRGRLSEGPQTLVQWFTQTEALQQTVGKIVVYANMFYTVDANDQQATAMNDRARGTMARALAATAFGEPELLQIGAETLANWMAQEPALQLYRQYLDTLERRRPYIRSAEVEQLLAAAREPFMSAAGVHGILANADLQFTPAQDSSGATVEVAQSNYHGLITHADRELRRSAWESYADAHLKLRNTMAACLATGVKQDVYFARARGYRSSLEAALTPNFIPVEVFHNLIATFRKHLPTWHRYWRIRRQALGYQTLHEYDIKAPLTQKAPQVPFQQAVDWIAAGMAPLGDEYVAALRRGALQQRWVDIYPNQGKRTGAFSSGVKGTWPFIFMSYTDDLFSLSTLAHELGHSLHSYFTWQQQPMAYARYGLFVAEVASNFNQALVRAYLLDQQSDPDFQIAVIEEAMSNFHRYFFIMPTLARFELEIHERVERGQALTADSMNALLADLFAEGYGEELQIDRERTGITWAEFSTHLYSNFYVYQYATGISGAHALAAAVLEGRPQAAERYLNFLRAGSSSYPLDVLREAGVDLTSPEPVEQTFAVLASLVDRLEQLV